MTTTTKPARTTRLIENGHSVHADEGAVRQDGPLPIYVCNTCKEQVVWATSSRTGRKYLVNVSRKMNGARFYMKQNTHANDCGARHEAELAEVREWKERQAEKAALLVPSVDRLERRYNRMIELMDSPMRSRPIPGSHRWALITHYVTETIEELDEVQS